MYHQIHEVHPTYSSVHHYGASRYQEYHQTERIHPSGKPSAPNPPADSASNASKQPINSQKAPITRQKTGEIHYKRRIFDHEEDKDAKKDAEKPEKGASSHSRPLLRSPTAQSIGQDAANQENSTALYTSHIPYNDISCIIEASAGEGGLYLGNMKAATDLAMLQKFNIRAVLNITTQDNALMYQNSSVTVYKYVEALDGEHVELCREFESCVKFIENARKSKLNVLVHCMAGISRSSTMVISYLMSSSKLSLHEALKFTRKRRPIVKPNNGFMYQLEEYGRKLREEERMVAVRSNTTRFAWF